MTHTPTRRSLAAHRLLTASERVVDLLRLEHVGTVALDAATDQVEAHCRDLELGQVGARFIGTAQLCHATSRRGVWTEFGEVAGELLEAARHAAGPL